MTIKGKKRPIKEEKNSIKKQKTSKDKVKKIIKSETIKNEIKDEMSAEASDEVKDEQSGDDSDENKFKWWENTDELDGEIKWDTLEHNGVLFPPEYEPLPSDVKLIYDGKKIDLPLEAEEVAGFFGALVETDHGKNPVFQKNFFADFLQVLDECHCNVGIKKFEKLDFSLIHAHFESERERKKALPPKEKKRIKEEKAANEEKFKFCTLNGRTEQVGNYTVEPPGLFRGRGAHPKTGKLKRRVYPEQITLNLGKDASIPQLPNGKSWKGIVHDQTVTWLAYWKENIMGSTKYVRFHQNSSFKGISDFKKFEKARELKSHIENIRKDYKKKLTSELMVDRQIATATYLIDIFALRAGGEKNDDEADTVGCCSLRFEHVFLKKPDTVVFDFLGKDSIRFYQEVKVDLQVFKNLKIFKKAPKKPGDDLFDRIDPSVLNKYFQGYMSGLTAKVFRTYNASKTMQDQIDKIENIGTVNEKVVAFNAANREVAILCNHQRTIPKTHQTSVGKIQERLEEMTWQRIKAKRIMLQIDPSLKKKKKEYFAEVKDFSKEKEIEIVTTWGEKEQLRIENKLVLDKKKLEYQKNEISNKEYNEKLKEIELNIKERKEKLKDNLKQYLKEAKSQTYETKSSHTVEKLEKQVDNLETRFKNTSLQLKDKEENSTVSLGTSKMNYIDPRLTVMFSKKFDVPLEKLFTKTLREKFEWAIESADENWRF